MILRKDFYCNSEKSELHKQIYDKIMSRNMILFPRVNDYLLNAVLTFEETKLLSGSGTKRLKKETALQEEVSKNNMDLTPDDISERLLDSKPEKETSLSLNPQDKEEVGVDQEVQSFLDELMGTREEE